MKENAGNWTEVAKFLEIQGSGITCGMSNVQSCPLFFSPKLDLGAG